ncbi:MAG: rod-binding protein [Pseudomonadota bacterium]
MELSGVNSISDLAQAISTPAARQLSLESSGVSAPFNLPSQNENDGVVGVNVASGASPARELEALIVSQMLDVMMPENDALFGEGVGSSMWRSMFVDVLSTEISGTFDLGIAAHIEGSLNVTSDSNDTSKGEAL